MRQRKTDKWWERRIREVGQVRECRERRFVYSAGGGGMSSQTSCIRNGVKRRSHVGVHLSFRRLSFKVFKLQQGAKPEIRPQSEMQNASQQTQSGVMWKKWNCPTDSVKSAVWAGRCGQGGADSGAEEGEEKAATWVIVCVIK